MRRSEHQSMYTLGQSSQHAQSLDGSAATPAHGIVEDLQTGTAAVPLMLHR